MLVYPVVYVTFGDLKARCWECEEKKKLIYMVVNRQWRKKEKVLFSQFIRCSISNNVYFTRLAVARLNTYREAW